MGPKFSVLAIGDSRSAAPRSALTLLDRNRASAPAPGAGAPTGNEDQS